MHLAIPQANLKLSLISAQRCPFLTVEHVNLPSSRHGIRAVRVAKEAAKEAEAKGEMCKKRPRGDDDEEARLCLRSQ